LEQIFCQNADRDAAARRAGNPVRRETTPAFRQMENPSG
jgi:hypothetical protein